MKSSEILQKIEDIEEQLGKTTNQQQYAALLQAQATFAIAYALKALPGSC